MLMKNESGASYQLIAEHGAFIFGKSQIFYVFYFYLFYLLAVFYVQHSPPHPDPTFVAVVNLVEVLQQCLTQYTQLLRPPGVSWQYVALLFTVLVHHHDGILLNEV